MSFDENFQRRWNEVIRPAVSKIKLDGVSLEPVRVDVRRISDSIVTEILQGIAHHLVVFADVTTIEYVGDKPIRSATFCMRWVLLTLFDCRKRLSYFVRTKTN